MPHPTPHPTPAGRPPRWLAHALGALIATTPAICVADEVPAADTRLLVLPLGPVPTALFESVDGPSARPEPHEDDSATDAPQTDAPQEPRASGAEDLVAAEEDERAFQMTGADRHSLPVHWQLAPADSGSGDASPAADPAAEAIAIELHLNRAIGPFPLPAGPAKLRVTAGDGEAHPDAPDWTMPLEFTVPAAADAALLLWRDTRDKPEHPGVAGLAVELAPGLTTSRGAIVCNLATTELEVRIGAGEDVITIAPGSIQALPAGGEPAEEPFADPLRLVLATEHQQRRLTLLRASLSPTQLQQGLVLVVYPNTDSGPRPLRLQMIPAEAFFATGNNGNNGNNGESTAPTAEPAPAALAGQRFPGP